MSLQHYINEGDKIKCDSHEFKRQRIIAKNALMKSGLPTNKMEDFRFSSMKFLEENLYQIQLEKIATQEEMQKLATKVGEWSMQLSAQTLIFIDGIFYPL